ncbi:MAG: hypothetical protein IJ193_05045 [Bacilli bacterium]|nr:hypothetical protein [Bacilli bacterium]
MANKAKKNSLIQEQNKSLFIICGVIIAIIALVGCLTLISGSKNDKEVKDTNDGIVDDIGAFKKTTSSKK